jgi:hypothetical protein
LVISKQAIGARDRQLNRLEGEVTMAIASQKGRTKARVEWTHDFFNFSTPKIPCETNCPFMVVTDTLNCQKELEGLVDMEEVRGRGRCPFWPDKDPQTERKGILGRDKTVGPSYRDAAGHRPSG